MNQKPQPCVAAHTFPMPETYSHRAVWAIALPMILASVTTPLVGLVGTAVMGHLDDELYLAAVAAAGQIFTVLFVGLNFLRMGTTGVTAQARGAGDSRGVRRMLGEATVLALVLGGLLILLQWPVRELALDLLGTGPDVNREARLYFDIRVWSAPAALFNFVALGWLLGMQDGRGPLLITLVLNLANVALSLLLVLVLGWKVAGVAVAALVAEYLGAGVALWLVGRKLARHPGAWPGRELLQPRTYGHLFRINSDLFIRTLALMFTFSYITALGARMGTVFLAANALLMNFQWFCSYALDGIANAAEALVGRAIGAGDRAGTLKAVRRTLGWSLAFAAVFSLAYLLAGSAIVAALTSLPEVRGVAAEYLPWLVALPVVSVWSFLYDGVYVGATRTRAMRNIMLASAALVFLPAWYLARDLGNHAIWLAFTLFMAARGLAMHWWFRRLVARGNLWSGAHTTAETLHA